MYRLYIECLTDNGGKLKMLKIILRMLYKYLVFY